jgi:hypothetical protein
MKFLIRRFLVFGVSLAVLIGCYHLLQDKLLRALTRFLSGQRFILCRGIWIRPGLVLAVIRTESSWQADSVSVAGARGLMQITSPTFDFILMKAGGKIINMRIFIRLLLISGSAVFFKLPDRGL